MRVFFTADTHFGHAGAISRFRRPFTGVAEMDEAMVARWNATVAPDDTVWHLGDFALRRAPDAMAALLDRLNGVKHLIAGNNDGPATRALPGWESVADYAEMVVDDTRLVLCHYAFRTWNGMYRGALNLHGHSHGQLKGMTRQYDVGVDVRDFRPVTVADLTARLRRGRTPPGPARR
ncbi:metallophosphoesterase family protein [Azospirillum halopraeferens]|uniref:metallophosphoesterase family protein n=1 Tax=Azospirillum halopraeferens TaxID=34010 RepID=UPI00048BBEF4|nr:metallophosphoesterase family protein [Azospirillum halopraeferens]